MDTATQVPWYKQLNGYQWWVLIAAALGWLFDTMDQRLFILARNPAIAELLADQLPENPTPADKVKHGDLVKSYGTYATAIFMLGWATGGLFFGVIGDRLGRVFTMLLTILIYSAFTGLSAFSTSWWDFAFYRLLAGIGVGGEFAAGVALVAEVMPPDARAYCLGILQALSAVGNIIGSTTGYFLLKESYWTIPAGWLGNAEPWEISSWRVLFMVGILPAILVVLVRRNLEEPESWTKAHEANEQADREGKPRVEMGSLTELLGEAQWRNRVLLGICISVAGIIGLWGIGFYTPELVGDIVASEVAAEKAAAAASATGTTLTDDQWAEEAKKRTGALTSWTTGLQDVGGFFGILAFSWLSVYMGRRPAFAITFLSALGATMLIFLGMRETSQIYYMPILLGFCNLSVFGGFAIYFPELFPTRLRSTGTGFCYNVSRYIAAAGPIFLGMLNSYYRSLEIQEPFRWAAVTVALIYILGIAVLPFAPETKDQPLPE